MLHLSESSTVIVIGPPGSGKSYVGELLAEQSGLPLYSTDEFLGTGHVEALYAVIKAVGDDGFIMEGMLGYRWLRKQKQLKMAPPDFVIELEATDDEIEEAYRKRQKPCNMRRIKAFCAAHEKILDDYMLLDGDLPRVWVHGNSPHVVQLITGGGEGAEPSD